MSGTGATVAAPGVEHARAVAGAVLDPEVPVLTLADLGVLRDVRRAPDGALEVDVTPTWSGCPALDAIRSDVAAALRAAGYADVRVRTVLAPAWSTDDITPAGRAALEAYGIAPPAPVRSAPTGAVALPLAVRCPQCGSLDTRETSRFGSTACKALRVCDACREPFDAFKTL